LLRRRPLRKQTFYKEVPVRFLSRSLLVSTLCGSFGCSVLLPRTPRPEQRACESVRGGLLAVGEIESEPPDLPPQHALVIAQVVSKAALHELPDMGVVTHAEWVSLLDGVGEDNQDPGWDRTQADLARRAGVEAVVTGQLRKDAQGYQLDLRVEQARDGRLLSRLHVSGATFEDLLAQEQERAHELLAPVGVLTPDEYDHP